MPGAAFLALLVVLSLSALPATPHAQPLPPVTYNIPMTTYGPGFSSPAMVAYLNATYYGSSLPPLNASWPILKLAGVITLNGQYNTYAVFMQQVYSFMVDMINAKGGVVVAGVPHLVSITWASDDSSTAMLLYLYQLWMNDPSYAVFLTPTQDQQMVLLNSLMLGSNRTFFNLFASDAADFTAHYPYIFTLLQTRDQVPVPSMGLLNQRAQQYHSAVQGGLVELSYEGETTSQWGLQNVCIYTHYDSAQILSCGGIRAWINATNQARLAAGAARDELIVVEQDVLWNIASTTVDQNLYTTTINACPDHVDALIICGQTSFADASAVSAALAATQLRPKVAFTTSTLPSYTVANATLATQWPGWTSLGSYPAQPASLPGPPTFSTVAQFKRDWSTYFNVSSAGLSTITLLYPSAMEILKGALASTASLSSDDLRAAFLALRGNTYIRNVQLNNLTGINMASISALGQVTRQAGLTVPSNVSLIVFPYDWPWTRVQVGDDLIMAQTSTNVIIGWVLVMLGCWVAQIIVEQAVFVRRRGGWYKAWLGLVATSLGGAGVWCSQWTMSSAVTLTKPGETSALSMQFSLDVAILAMLPAIILTWCGLYMLMRDVEDNSKEVTSKHNSAAHVTRQINKEQRAEKRKRAALSYAAHFYHLKDSLSRNVLAGSVLVALAVSVTRVTLWYNWSCQASLVSTASGWIVSLVVDVLLLCPALLMYFHALKLRTVAVFMLAGAVMIDWQVHLYTMSFKYALNVLVTPSELYTALLSATAVQLITGILTAVTCFGFIGLQFSRMQLSRNGLSVLVASLENVINKQKAALQEEQHQSGYLRLQADELARMLEAINIVRPISKEYAWALASCSNTSTFRQQVDQATCSHTGTTAVGTVSPIPATDRLASNVGGHASLPVPPTARAPLTISSSPSTAPRLTVAITSTSTASAPVTAGKGTAIIALAQSDKDSPAVSDDDNLVDPQTGARRSSLSDSTIQSDIATPMGGAGRVVLPSPTVSHLSSSPSGSAARSMSRDGPTLSVNSKVGWMENSTVTAATPTKAAGAVDGGGEQVEDGDSVVADMRKGRSSIVSTRSSHATCQVAPLSPQQAIVSQSTVAKHEQPSSSQPAHPSQETRIDVEPSKTSDSANSLSVSAQVTQIDHHSRWKQYEADLTNLLHQQAQHATTAALEQPHVADATRGSVSVSSLAGKALGSQSGDELEFTMAAAGRTKPTLMELLAHPVCVELLKDELERIHSVENLVFYLHAVRYRRLQTAKTRRMLATQIYDTFVADGSPQQINISTRQRDTIAAQLRRRGDDSATPALFREAEREVALLMETNVMKAFVGSTGYRLCGLVLAGLDVDKASGKWGEQRRGGVGGAGAGGNGWGDGRGSLVTDAMSSQGSRKHSVEPSRAASSINNHNKEQVQA